MNNTQKNNRMSWDEYFCEIARLIAKRSTCLRRHVGAVIVKNNRILATGYNGSPSGLQNCCDRGYCLRQHSKQGEDLDVCFAIHGEMNAILQCSKYGISCEDAIIYVTTFPCIHCMKAIINAGIKEIVFLEDYNAPLSKQLAIQSEIKIRKYEGD